MATFPLIDSAFFPNNQRFLQFKHRLFSENKQLNSSLPVLVLLTIQLSIFSAQGQYHFCLKVLPTESWSFASNEQLYCYSVLISFTFTIGPHWFDHQHLPWFQNLMYTPSDSLTHDGMDSEVANPLHERPMGYEPIGVPCIQRTLGS